MKRATKSEKPGKLWMMEPGARVERVTIDFGIERPFAATGTIVGEPFRESKFAWKVAIQWDHRQLPETVDTRRVRVVSAKSARN